MALKKKPFIGIGSVLFLLLAGCLQQAEMAPTTSESAGAVPQAAFAQFPDIPIPAGSKLVLDRTMVLGSGENWMGQMVVNADQTPLIFFDFLKQKMPEFGWNEMTSVRASVSVLTYSRRSRIASIQIQSRTIGGSEAIFTVSPANEGGGSMGSGLGGSGGGYSSSPSPAPAPVRSAPLKSPR